MTSRIHRVLRRVAISLALGAIVTVLVAWGCHRFGWMEGTRTEIENPEWPITVPATWPPAPERAERREDGPIAIESFVKWWPEGRGGSQFHALMYQSGWPCHAMIRYVAYEGGPERPQITNHSMLHSGVPSPFNLQWTNIPHANYLPVLPLWPGFAINALFYGAFVFAAMGGASALRRRRRFKRGLCVQCAYPRTGGEICPECGHSVLRGVACASQIKAAPPLA